MGANLRPGWEDMRRIAGVCVVAGSATLAGCIAGGSSRVETHGVPISETTLASIEAGVTEESYVRSLLGEPSRTARGEDGSVTYVYEYRKVEDSSGHFLLLFSGDTRDEVEQVVYVRCVGGVVERVWRDGAA